MNKGSTWTALNNAAFRRLWVATVISGTCMATHDNAATWMMKRHSDHDLAGAMALGGVIWGSAGAIAGTSYTLLGAAVLFLTSMSLVRRLSINFSENEVMGSGNLSIRAEPKEVTPPALTSELLPA